MMHRVICSTCGKEERISVERGKRIEGKWKYYGKICLNSYSTDKYYYRWDDFTSDKWTKEKNPNYNPEIHPKYAEYWECPDHY